MILKITEFIIYSSLIVIISKYILVNTLRKLAENLNLKPKTVGNIAGYATSMPELLTVSISSLNGLISTSIFNIISSNVINFIQYIASIIMNKNREALNNKAIKIDLIMVVLTIIIPLFILWKNMEIDFDIIPIFLIIYFLFIYLNNNVNKLYLQKENREIQKKFEEEGKTEKGNTRKTLLYVIILIITGVVLYLISELLGNSLDNLCNELGISQIIIGLLLGFITSIPELITFFESQQHYKRQNNNMLGVIEATNNLLTSNILNLFLIESIGICLYNFFKNF